MAVARVTAARSYPRLCPPSALARTDLSATTALVAVVIRWVMPGTSLGGEPLGGPRRGAQLRHDGLRLGPQAQAQAVEVHREDRLPAHLALRGAHRGELPGHHRRQPPEE